MRLRLSELAERLEVPLHGDGSIEIRGVAGIREAKEGELTFLGNPKYAPYLATTKASAIIMPEVPDDVGIPVLESPRPHLAYVKALKIFSNDSLGIVPGIHPTAIIGKDVQIGEDVSIGPHVVIGNESVLGDRLTVMAGCFIGGRVKIGTDGFLYPHVVVREDSLLGERVIVHSGAVIGSDGFGFHRDGDTVQKVPQIGNVEIGDDVEIGANSTIDRATTGTTKIGRGTKIDNLVMIAHNVEIGENSFLCAQVGISGSTAIGSNVTLGGQAGLVGHIEVGDRVQVGAQGGVTKSVPPDMSVSGYPALPHGQARRIYASMRAMPEMLRTVRRLTQRIAELEEKLDRGREG